MDSATQNQANEQQADIFAVMFEQFGVGKSPIPRHRKRVLITDY